MRGIAERAQEAQRELTARCHVYEREVAAAEAEAAAAIARAAAAAAGGAGGADGEVNRLLERIEELEADAVASDVVVKSLLEALKTAEVAADARVETAVVGQRADWRA